MTGTFDPGFRRSHSVTIGDVQGQDVEHDTCLGDDPDGRADGHADGDMANTRRRYSVGAFDAALIQHMQQHLVIEHGVLSDYGALAACDDEPVAYLAGLILEEEQRHHRILTEMLNQFHANAGLDAV
jgi:hypothetical protein